MIDHQYTETSPIQNTMSAQKRTFVYSELGGTDQSFLTDQGSLEEVRAQICTDIRSIVADANADGVVVAMSGGIDSTVTTTLAVEALGSDRVLGLALPCHKAEQAHANDARTIADGLGIEFEELQLRPLLEAFRETVEDDLDPETERDKRPHERNQTIGNIVARLRMCCAYYTANRHSRLVLGTANRSELLLGYFTKYGDGAADAYPIGDLYKTEVRALANQLGLPRRIIYKEPTAGFWTGQTDAAELGAPYNVIDPLLYRFIDKDESIDEAADALEIDHQTARDIVLRYMTTSHKRTVPPSPGISGQQNDRLPYSLHYTENRDRSLEEG